METCQRNQTITRYRPPGIIPLELWDLSLDGRILWEAMSEVEFPQILRTSIDMLRRGDGETRSEGPVPQVIAGFDCLHVAGRRSEEFAIIAALRALNLPVTFSRNPGFPGQEEGLHLLASMGSPTGWICDLGQAAFKISANDCRMRFERNFEQLPVRTDATDRVTEEQRQLLRKWLGESMRLFSAKAGSPDATLFAMASRLNDDAVPEGSSYIGMGGDRGLVPDILSNAGLSPQRVLVLNDAELAAMEVLAEDRFWHFQKTLVITLGFGLGAALAVRPVQGGLNHG